MPAENAARQISETKFRISVSKTANPPGYSLAVDGKLI